MLFLILLFSIFFILINLIYLVLDNYISCPSNVMVNETFFCLIGCMSSPISSTIIIDFKDNDIRNLNVSNGQSSILKNYSKSGIYYVSAHYPNLNYTATINGNYFKYEFQ